MIAGLSVARASQPLLRAKRIAVRYSLRDLLPGSRHRFGLVDVDAAGIKLTLTRFRNGSFDIALPGAGPPPAGPQPVNAVPLRFHARVRDVQVELREPTAFDESARTIRIDGINGEASVDSAAVTQLSPCRRLRRAPARAVHPVGDESICRPVSPCITPRRLGSRCAPSRTISRRRPDVRILHGGASNFDAVVYALGRRGRTSRRRIT